MGEPSLYCSFCATPNTEVRKMVAAPMPGVGICDMCTDICYEMVHEETAVDKWRKQEADLWGEMYGA